MAMFASRTAKYVVSLGRRTSPEKCFLENQWNLFRNLTTAFQGEFVFQASIWNQKEIRQKETWFLPITPQKNMILNTGKAQNPNVAYSIHHTSVLKEIHISLWTEIYHLSHTVLFLNHGIWINPSWTLNALPWQLTPKALQEESLTQVGNAPSERCSFPLAAAAHSVLLYQDKNQRSVFPSPGFFSRRGTCRRERCLIQLKQNKEGISSITQLQ